jgi:hypothetical protein
MCMWMFLDQNEKIMGDQNVYVNVTWLEWKENRNYRNVYVNVTWLEWKDNERSKCSCECYMIGIKR